MSIAKIVKVVKKKEPFFPKTVNKVYSTGRRKTSVARVWVADGTGRFLINYMPAEKYFPSFSLLKDKLFAPFKVLNLEENKYDIFCTVKGGGFTGQVEAIRHAISRIMSKPGGVEDPDIKKQLRQAHLITRDSREVERKKYGHRKARKVSQYSKR